MDEILLASGCTGVLAALEGMEHTEIRRLELEHIERPTSPSSTGLLVLDAPDYLAMDADGRRRLSGYLKLLIADPQEPVAHVAGLRRPSVQVFCPSAANVLSEQEAQNLITIIHCLFAQQQMAARLNSYITDSFQTIIDAQIVERQKQEIEKLNEELHSISRVDFLTNLLNRRAFLESLEAETKRAQRNRWRLGEAAGQPLPLIEKVGDPEFAGRPRGDIVDHIGKLSCMVMDIDFFKKVNDTYGHLAGDMVLRKLGHVLQEKGLFRENDLVGRYGGEEFIVVLPETSAQHARIPAERLRKKIKETVFVDDHGHSFSITLSIGIAEAVVGEESTESLIHRADVALYHAKEHGRDRVCIHEEIEPPVQPQD
ncbi:GGDEF domain-containing protein [Spirochaeta africana]|uniref:diguanylate cyclase n=1 Tax=Spirochaeta africana (strain ATCC 700263 / DSM 8902 / Z-7692) TaxID=889378 RepID=H9UFD1_SPIAZ|nr:GGDEF domain-containing protein [Spirochaeta africana]AFG36224.1 diguanylate cyclase (GGDEF) domain-containing protein [Spirochaeta africana DSM 8902]